MKTYKSDTICQVNPPKFDMSEDMADLTFLGDACVLWNSVVRYKAQLIYTYSSASPSTRTRGSPSTPSAPWRCMSARGGLR